MSQMNEAPADAVADTGSAAVENNATTTENTGAAPAEGGDSGQTAPEAGAEFGGGDWKEQLPEAWRGQMDGVNSLEEALDAMKRGMDYRPAANADDLVSKWPDNVEYDEQVNREFRELGVKIGLTKEQAQALVDFECRSQQEMEDRAIEADIQELRAAWGDSFEANANKAMETMLRIDKLMDNRLSAALGVHGIKGSPVLMEAFANIGRLISEDTISGGSPAAGKEVTESAEDMFRGMFH